MSSPNPSVNVAVASGGTSSPNNAGESTDDLMNWATYELHKPIMKKPPCPGQSPGWETEDRLDGGVIIRRVTPGKVAANAGLREGDIVYSVNAIRVENKAAMKKELFEHKSSSRLTIFRERMPAVKTYEFGHQMLRFHQQRCPGFGLEIAEVQPCPPKIQRSHLIVKKVTPVAAKIGFNVTDILFSIFDRINPTDYENEHLYAAEEKELFMERLAELRDEVIDVHIYRKYPDTGETSHQSAPTAPGQKKAQSKPATPSVYVQGSASTKPPDSVYYPSPKQK